MSERVSSLVASAALLGAVVAGCAPRPVVLGAPDRAVDRPVASSATVAKFLDAVRDDPVQLRMFLRDMPKGGDLHTHSGGAVYAESYARWAAEDGLCLVTATLALVPPPCDAEAGRVAAARLFEDGALFDAAVDAWSMRHWSRDRTPGPTQFFDSFNKFGLAARARWGDVLAEITSRAGAQRVSYVELMFPVDDGVGRRLGSRLTWTGDHAAMRDAVLAAGLRDSLRAPLEKLDAAEARRRSLLGCGTERADAGCDVTVRYQLPALRATPPHEVFAQLVAGFELATLDARIVGVNLVQPEHAPVSLRDFALQMEMLDFLHGVYPRVAIALHAGELTEGLAPPESLRFHIRRSIERGHARRIGHGVAIAHEDDAPALLRQMAASRVLVEVALSSNDGILGVSGAHHPLRTYLSHGVPVALATDDEGVSRSSLTREFERAVTEHHVDYAELTRMARASLEFAFVDDVEKARLLERFDRDTAAFEARWAARVSPAGR